MDQSASWWAWLRTKMRQEPSAVTTVASRVTMGRVLMVQVGFLVVTHAEVTDFSFDSASMSLYHSAHPSSVVYVQEKGVKGFMGQEKLQGSR